MQPSTRRRLVAWGMTLLLLAAGGCATSSAAGDQLMKAGKPAEAAKAYQEALAKSPGDPFLLGKLETAREAVGRERLTAGAERLAKGDPAGAYRLFHEALVALPNDARATDGESRALAEVVAGIDLALTHGKYQAALDAAEAARKAGVPEATLALPRRLARTGLSRAACEDAKRFEAKRLLGNALVTFMKARALSGGCDADAGIARVRAALDRQILLGLRVDVAGDRLAELVAPLIGWLASTGAPVRVELPPGTIPGKAAAPPSQAVPSPPATPVPPAKRAAPVAHIVAAGHYALDHTRTEKPENVTLTRTVGHRTEANPEYAKLLHQSQQLAQQIERQQDLVASQARYVESLQFAYLTQPTTALYQALQDAVDRLQDMRRVRDDMTEQYLRIRQRMSSTTQLVKKTLTEEAKVTARRVTLEARVKGDARISAPWLAVPETVSLSFASQASGYAWSANATKDIEAHAADLPDVSTLERRAIAGAGRALLSGVKKVLAARADGLAADGARARKAGRADAAVEAYVRALLLDPASPRVEARRYLGEARGATLAAPRASAGAPASSGAGGR